MKRIVTVQDISCVGKCSLTVALPIISAMGVEAAVLPTAVLSTHTAFKGFTFRDLTGDMRGIMDHWKAEEFRFDAVYSGYLGSAEQIECVEKLSDFLAPGAPRIVDPAMADDGKLYPGFDASFPGQMAKLVSGADIAVPNLTELCLLLDMPYRENYSTDELKDLLRRLSASGARNVVLTGYSPEAASSQQNVVTVGALVYSSSDGKFFEYCDPLIPRRYHGTGDIFASVLTGAVVRGCSLEEAVKIAVDFTFECVRLTQNDPFANWYGVNFEAAIPYLVSRVNVDKSAD